MKGLVAAIDCGTTTIKAGVFSLDGKIKGIARIKYPCILFKDGRIEQDPGLILRKSLSCLREAIRRSRTNPTKILSLSISNQRATVICIDKNSDPIGNAISWQDMRGTRMIAALCKKIDDKRYYNITGLPNNPVFSLGKILSVKNTPVFNKTSRFALIQDYLLKSLGAEDFFIDLSNASLTGLLDIERSCWSKEILHLAGLSENKLPALVASGEKLGAVSKSASARCGLLQGTPLVSGGGDQQCAGIGAGAVEPGIAEYTLGTAGVLLACVDKRVKDPLMRITCLAHAVPGKFEVEGLQNAAGASLDWIREVTGDGDIFGKAFFRKIASVPPGAFGALFYPFLAGASAPNWNPKARAVLMGLSHIHDKTAIVRSVLEGVSLEARQILEVFKGLRIPVREIRLTGGASGIVVWNRIQADIYGKKVITLSEPDASLLGAAILAAYGVGAFRSVQEAAKKMVRVEDRFYPVPRNTKVYDKIYKRYCDSGKKWLREF